MFLILSGLHIAAHLAVVYISLDVPRVTWPIEFPLKQCERRFPSWMTIENVVMDLSDDGGTQGFVVGHPQLVAVSNGVTFA